ncbi:hypothetical protein AXF42_Ash019926 [Apostasia shenzhenica]|uniref:F-box domain-containing protein n=1 Tax=Apostasia shenzhenica TaxID=1088818 RepID=A0A2H9ZYU0_9ASPA|nr:hypothetical protein AXF42_Ash019926 [Apostasia shenzhenica]
MDGQKRCRVFQGEGRRWSDLPDLALNQIAVRVCGPGDFLAFSRVCRAWRAVAKVSMKDFGSSPSRRSISSHVLLLLGPSKDPHISSDSSLFYCPSDGLLYEKKLPHNPVDAISRSITRNGELSIIGQSCNSFIAVDAATRRIPSIIEIFTRRRYDFPPLCDGQKFDFALLTASRRDHKRRSEGIRFRCMLVLVVSQCSPGRGRLLCCYLHGPRWCSATHPGPITDAIVCFDKLVINCSTSLLYLKLDNPGHVVHQCNIPNAARGGEGKPPLLVRLTFIASNHLLFLKLNDRGDSVLAYTCYQIGHDGSEDMSWIKYSWPVGTNLWLAWERSDLFCTFDDFIRSGGINKVTGRVVNHDDELWANYGYKTNGISVTPVAHLAVKGAIALSCFQLTPSVFVRGIP